MENIIPSQNYQVESLFKCNKCEREYRTKSSLTRHTHIKHEAIDIVKLKLKNENLLLKIDLYNEQIKFLKTYIDSRAYPTNTWTPYFSTNARNRRKH